MRTGAPAAPVDSSTLGDKARSRLRGSRNPPPTRSSVESSGGAVADDVLSQANATWGGGSAHTPSFVLSTRTAARVQSHVGFGSPVSAATTLRQRSVSRSRTLSAAGYPASQSRTLPLSQRPTSAPGVKAVELLSGCVTTVQARWAYKHIYNPLCPKPLCPNQWYYQSLFKGLIVLPSLQAPPLPPLQQVNPLRPLLLLLLGRSLQRRVTPGARACAQTRRGLQSASRRSNVRRARARCPSLHSRWRSAATGLPPHARSRSNLPCHRRAPPRPPSITLPPSSQTAQPETALLRRQAPRRQLPPQQCHHICPQRSSLHRRWTPCRRDRAPSLALHHPADPLWVAALPQGSSPTLPRRLGRVPRAAPVAARRPLLPQTLFERAAPLTCATAPSRPAPASPAPWPTHAQQ